jgi:hypothetical protein
VLSMSSWPTRFAAREWSTAPSRLSACAALGQLPATVQKGDREGRYFASKFCIQICEFSEIYSVPWFQFPEILHKIHVSFDILSDAWCLQFPQLLHLDKKILYFM